MEEFENGAYLSLVEMVSVASARTVRISTTNDAGARSIPG